jgi:hypothetical protein
MFIEITKSYNNKEYRVTVNKSSIVSVGSLENPQDKDKIRIILSGGGVFYSTEEYESFVTRLKAE